LYIHFRQSQRQRPFAAEAFFQGVRVEIAFAHLRHIKGDWPDTRGDGLGFVPVCMGLAFCRALIGLHTEMLLRGLSKFVSVKAQYRVVVTINSFL
jgi:hypothetical protein